MKEREGVGGFQALSGMAEWMVVPWNRQHVGEEAETGSSVCLFSLNFLF